MKGRREGGRNQQRESERKGRKGWIRRASDYSTIRLRPSRPGHCGDPRQKFLLREILCWAGISSANDPTGLGVDEQFREMGVGLYVHQIWRCGLLAWASDHKRLP